MAHLYFESVHPFEDGNGRIGRAIAEKSLAQSLGQPPLIALASTILARRARYYTELEAANKKNEITNWLAWFAGVIIEAQRRTIALIEVLIDRTKLLDGLSGKVNGRQQKALQRMFREGRGSDGERRIDQGRGTQARPLSAQHSPAARAAYFRERAREVGRGIEMPVEDEDCAHSEAAGAGVSELEVGLRVAACVILR